MELSDKTKQYIGIIAFVFVVGIIVWISVRWFSGSNARKYCGGGTIISSNCQSNNDCNGTDECWQGQCIPVSVPLESNNKTRIPIEKVPS